MASTEPEHEHREEEEAPTNEDKDTGAQVAPIVKLEEIVVTTGEEDETSILDLYVSLSFLSHSLYSYGFPFFFIVIWLNLGIFYFTAKLNFTDLIKMGTNGKREVLVLSSFSSTKSTRDKREKKLIN